ncbi:MAG TPA: nuclear transport factor 2 family protein [Caulobacteraceae bacterium]|nr:nuclear transport factor 2 family protein [Caulobacteraceae bacterium]
MRVLWLGLAGSLALGGAAAAATTRAELTAPITAFNDAFAKGDVKAAAATYAPDVSITDEVPPYSWRGPAAFTTWAQDLTANDKKLGITAEKLALGDVVRSETDGRHAYVVMAAVYSFNNAKGAPMHENARMTFALRKGADGWKIAGWTFTSARASADKAPAAPKATAAKP